MGWGGETRTKTRQKGKTRLEIKGIRGIYKYTYIYIYIYVCVCVCYVEIKCQLDATDDFYCRFYCILNMFRAILCPSSGAPEYYTDGRFLWYLVLWFSGCRYGVVLEVVCPVLQTGHTTLSSTTYRQLEN